MSRAGANAGGGPRLVAGCMTGTSLDGIDVAIASIDDHGLAIRAKLVGSASLPLGPVGATLRRLADQHPMTAGEIAEAARAFALLHADAVEIAAAGRPLDLVCVHGQTVHHRPPASWQLFQPAPLLERCRCPVVFDLRQADLAAGGQGAPITPIADLILFRDARETRVVINLGGFSNFTLLPAGEGTESVRGGDVCACNHLLDALARDAAGVAYDADGRMAAAGRVDRGLRDDIAALLLGQLRERRSLGSGDELVARVLVRAGGAPGNDRLRSVCDAIGLVVGDVARAAAGDRRPARLVLAGGGARNPVLAASIADHATLPACTTAELGVPVELREALAMAVLGTLCADGVPITLPAITGVRSPAPLAGVWAGRMPA